MELLIGILVVVLSSLIILYGYFKYSYRYWISKGVPCDNDGLVIPYGHLKGIGKTVQMHEFIKKIYDQHKKSGSKLCGAYFFVRPVVILLDLDLAKRIMVQDFSNFGDRNAYYNEVDDPIIANLVALDGEKWKQLRAKLTPTFSSGKIKFMFPTIIEVADRFRECLLEKLQHQDQFEMKDWCARFSTDVIGTCAFGIEVNSLKDPDAIFRQYGRKITGAPRHNTIIRTLLRQFKGMGRWLHMKYIRDDVSKFFMDTVKETIEYRETNNINRNDFMNILIKLKNSPDKDKALTLNEIAAHSYVFFLGGFDTSSAALTFCLYELSLNLDIQDKARRVIQEAYKKHNEQFTYEMFSDLSYIDQIIEETLRKYPPGPLLHREAKNDYHIPESNINIERGTTVIIPLYAIHQDPEYYPNPEKFDPDRFDSGEKLKRHPMEWLPFGKGPRDCIAQRFGMLEFKVGLVMLLKHFEFTPGPKIPTPISLILGATALQPKDDIVLKIKAL